MIEKGFKVGLKLAAIPIEESNCQLKKSESNHSKILSLISHLGNKIRNEKIENFETKKLIKHFELTASKNEDFAPTNMKLPK